MSLRHPTLTYTCKVFTLYMDVLPSMDGFGVSNIDRSTLNLDFGHERYHNPSSDPSWELVRYTSPRAIHTDYGEGSYKGKGGPLEYDSEPGLRRLGLDPTPTS